MPSKPVKKTVAKTTATAKASAEAATSSKKAPQPIQIMRGMRDLVPNDQPYWQEVRDTVASIAGSYGFDRIDTPIVEETALFIRGVGRATDVVEKELYRFDTFGGEDAALRPEGTAGVVRSYIQHGMLNVPQPVKLWYEGPMFRYDRPQSGRFRQFYQAGFECIGEEDAIVDAQLIVLGWNVLKSLGIDAVLRINSLGTPESRANYKNALVAYFRAKKAKLSDEDKKRLLKNPLRLLDSKDPVILELKAEAPQLVDWLDEDSKAHFMRVLEYLDELGVPYQLDPYLVRGLDYYTKTVWEWYASTEDAEQSQSALGGGGRYDGLVELLGGRPTPAVGCAFGVDRIISRLKEKNPPSPDQHRYASVDVFIAQLGDMGRKKALALFEEFREAGIPVGEAFAKSNIKAQMEVANKRQAKWALVLGQKEVLDGTVLIRDMDAGSQETVDIKKAVHEIKKKLQNLKP
ncbi:MAG: histidine--tRNA ligase [Candidatus Magasanikbacteria bacterium]|nr:histidine--tRNA ligase [Candidatus Magasanikbacteria bacterium]MCA9391203.1 histidine--tRNA ligase [Candidatus Magasanikbacteria bacterium]